MTYLKDGFWATIMIVSRETPPNGFLAAHVLQRQGIREKHNLRKPVLWGEKVNDSRETFESD